MCQGRDARVGEMPESGVASKWRPLNERQKEQPPLTPTRIEETNLTRICSTQALERSHLSCILRGFATMRASLLIFYIPPSSQETKHWFSFLKLSSGPYINCVRTLSAGVSPSSRPLLKRLALAWHFRPRQAPSLVTAGTSTGAGREGGGPPPHRPARRRLEHGRHREDPAQRRAIRRQRHETLPGTGHGHQRAPRSSPAHTHTRHKHTRAPGTTPAHTPATLAGHVRQQQLTQSHARHQHTHARHVCRQHTCTPRTPPAHTQATHATSSHARHARH